MSTQVTIKTVDGRIITGISYTQSASRISNDPSTNAAIMAGGAAYGTYHLQSPGGWVAVPASQVASVLPPVPGANT
jgi:hypothetical protein